MTIELLTLVVVPVLRALEELELSRKSRQQAAVEFGGRLADSPVSLLT